MVRKKTPRGKTRGVSKVAARQDDSAGGALLLGEEASEHEGISCSMLARTRMECGRNLIRGAMAATLRDATYWGAAELFHYSYVVALGGRTPPIRGKDQAC